MASILFSGHTEIPLNQTRVVFATKFLSTTEQGERHGNHWDDGVLHEKIFDHELLRKRFKGLFEVRAESRAIFEERRQSLASHLCIGCTDMD